MAMYNGTGITDTPSIEPAAGVIADLVRLL
jgi:hypothetical protein